MIRKYHNHKLQTHPWHREEEPLNHHETPGRQIKQSNQLSLPHQDEVKWLISKKTIIFQGSRGGSTFSRGVQLFPGGSNCLFPIETHITCDFSGGGGSGTPVPPSGSALELNEVLNHIIVIYSDHFS